MSSQPGRETVKTIDKVFKKVFNLGGSSHTSLFSHFKRLTRSKLLQIFIKRRLENLDVIPLCSKKTDAVVLSHW